jgi:hypothetical protein
MKASSVELKGHVKELHNEVKSVGGPLVSVLTSLESVAKDKEGLAKVLQSLDYCKDIANRMLQTRLQIEGSAPGSENPVPPDHYSAVASLDQLQRELILLRSSPQLNPMLVCLQIWLPIGKERLLKQVRLDANVDLLNLRFDQSRLIGETLLRRKAATVISDNRLNMKLTQLHHRTRAKITEMSSTISSIYVETCENFMLFSQWCGADEFDSIIPSNYFEEPTDKGHLLLGRRLLPINYLLHIICNLLSIIYYILTIIDREIYYRYKYKYKYNSIYLLTTVYLIRLFLFLNSQ